MLAIDIGTTRTKTALYDDELRRGPTIGISTAGMDAEGTFDVAAIVDSVVSLIKRKRVSRHRERTDLRAIGITSFLSHILYDEHGEILGRGMSWAFQPAPEAIEACVAACNAVGWRLERPAGAELLAPRLVHLARYQPERARRIARVVSVKDVVRAALTCEAPRARIDLSALVIDESFRDYSFLRDRNDRPIEPILDLLRREGYADPGSLLPPTQPPHYPAGCLARTPATSLHLPEGIPVATGASDGTTAMYGGGVLADTCVVAVFGTTDVAMRAVPAGETSDSGDENISRNAAARSGYELIGGSTSASGSALRWMKNMLVDASGWDHAPRGAAGIKVAPSFSGERAPWNLPGRCGAIAGLTLNHTGAYLARALVEAHTYRARLLIERITGDEPDSFVVIGGGGNRTPQLDALRDDVLPWPLVWRRDTELSLCGAAIFASAAAIEDERERDATLLDLSRRAAGDVDARPQGAVPHENTTETSAAYETLYREWLEWISRLYGETE